MPKLYTIINKNTGEYIDFGLAGPLLAYSPGTLYKMIAPGLGWKEYFEVVEANELKSRGMPTRKGLYLVRTETPEAGSLPAIVNGENCFYSLAFWDGKFFRISGVSYNYLNVMDWQNIDHMRCL